MNVLMICSSRENIDPYYISIARNVAQYLAQDDIGCDLIFGGCSSSMMGVCYEEFIKNGRHVSSFTTEKYVSDLINLEQSDYYVENTTFSVAYSSRNLKDGTTDADTIGTLDFTCKIAL